MIIKGFENEDIKVSEFGQWFGNDYVDYKFEYKNQKKVIDGLYKENQQLKEQQKEFINYLKKEINKISEQIEHYDLWHEVGIDINFLILRKQMFEILSKIEKE